MFQSDFHLAGVHKAMCGVTLSGDSNHNWVYDYNCLEALIRGIDQGA
jgi:hypothetical protein